MTRSVLLLAAAVLVAACGSSEDDAVSTACMESPTQVVKALGRAPGEVTLADGTRLSSCVSDATSEAELQNVGVALSQAAEELEARAASDPRAALQLGYLVGAARRGGGSPVDGGFQAELVRRLERSAALDGASADARRSLREGLAAGERSG
jgi:hypothetical protein